MLPCRIVRHVYRHRSIPNVVKPRTFSEKRCYKMTIDRNPRPVTVADQRRVREVVRERVDEQPILSKLYALLTNADSMRECEFLSRFVVKPKRGGGWIFLQDGKTELNLAELLRLAKGWLNTDDYY